MYLCTGWELLSLEGRWFARQLVRDGVSVVFEEYEAMPHTFALMLPKSVSAANCYEHWVGFVKQVMEEPEKVGSVARRVSAKTQEVTETEFEEICEVGEEQMRERIREFAGGKAVDAKL